MSESLQPVRPTSAFRGAFYTVGLRWGDRLLGLASTLVLARLLAPADFGLVAMAMVVVGLLDVLLDLGVSTALIQNPRADADDFHTAWTLRLIQSGLAALLLVLAAPFAADYYRDERVVAILYVVAITVFAGGLENIGIVSFQRNLEFGRDFQFFFLKRVLAVVFTIAAAIVLRSYWALVLGNLVSRCAGVAFSYRFSAFRPRWSVARFRGIWSFSQWNLLTGIGRYLNGAVGRFLIGGRGGATDLGTYTVAEEIAAMPITELLAPLGRVMFPVFAQVRDDRAELLRVVSLAQSVQALIAIPASIGVALVAADAIPLLLGNQWHAAIPIVQIMALAGVSTSLGHSMGYLLTALGRVRTVCAFTWAKVLLFCVLVYAAVPNGSVVGVALAFLATALAGFVAFQLAARRLLPGLGGRALLRQVWRPLVATSVMGCVVLAVGRLLANSPQIIRLAAEVLAGAAVYAAAVYALWRSVGSPAGPESYILDRVRSRSV